jgi:thioredoxin reductase (NADPH)
MKVYDTIIVGAGPAGLTAAIFTCRRRMTTLVISTDVGGQTNLSSKIENYPGVDSMPGYKLMEIFFRQAKGFGTEFVTGRVTKIKRSGKAFKAVLSNGNEYRGRTIILAFGKTPRTLEVPGEDKFMGKGIFTCATCDAPLFEDKTVAVIGGGNSALDATLLLDKIAKKIYLIHRRDEFRGDEILVERARKSKKIEFVLNSVVTEFKGDKFLKSIVVKNKVTNKEKEIKVDGVFLEIGYVVKSDFVKDLVKLNEYNEIIVDERCKTSCDGIFAAGDVTNTPFKQTIVAAGEGAKAGLQAYIYLHGEKMPRSLDWGH